MSPMRQARAVGDLHILEHSLVAAKMSVLRNKTTATLQFRRTLEQIAILLFDRSIEKVADTCGRTQNATCGNARR